MIPGEDLQLPEGDLLTNIGKYLSLYEHEQRKRIILVQAYNEMKAELDAFKNPAPPKLSPDDVVLGMP
jgi:hypothetical protein